MLIFSDESEYPNEKNKYLGEATHCKSSTCFNGGLWLISTNDTTCEIVDVEKATVYGEYRNQLSIIAKVVEVDEVIDL